MFSVSLSLICRFPLIAGLLKDELIKRQKATGVSGPPPSSAPKKQDWERGRQWLNLNHFEGSWGARAHQRMWRLLYMPGTTRDCWAKSWTIMNSSTSQSLKSKKCARICWHLTECSHFITFQGSFVGKYTVAQPNEETLGQISIVYYGHRGQAYWESSTWDVVKKGKFRTLRSKRCIVVFFSKCSCLFRGSLLQL